MIRSTSKVLALAFILLVVVGWGGMAIGTASAQAQDGGNYAGSEDLNRSEAIDSDTFLVDAEYSDSDQSVTVTLRSEIDQQITVSDAGVFMVGGEIESRTVDVDANSSVEITVPVTETDRNLVAVGIETKETAYAVPPFRTPREQTNVFDRTTSTAGWLGGASASLFMVGLSAWNKVRKRNSEPEELTENV